MGVNEWRRVEGVMADRKISRRLKGKVSDVVCHAGLPLRSGDRGTDRQQQRLQVYENTWVMRIMGVKMVDRRRTDELREEIGVQ